ncbi:hypothetical protein NDU88_007201 [Pleurodeles waltl]|uniref:Uncharacterized protein n=1 Tax=Pleurodeles waltl TaxID=8319 RepID=A0AAV7P1I0_PLEWA|nr:hypothetical protein NDU88_007201 [Pleurodeles waltl]
MPGRGTDLALSSLPPPRRGAPSSPRGRCAHRPVTGGRAAGCAGPCPAAAGERLAPEGVAGGSGRGAQDWGAPGGSGRRARRLLRGELRLGVWCPGVCSWVGGWVSPSGSPGALVLVGVSAPRAAVRARPLRGDHCPALRSGALLPARLRPAPSAGEAPPPNRGLKGRGLGGVMGEGGRYRAPGLLASAVQSAHSGLPLLGTPRALTPPGARVAR